MSQRPVWAEISIPRLKRNYALLRAAAPGVELMAVVKANAYGHSASLCAPALAEAGARWLGVTCLEEGIAVRRLCPEARILLMSGIWEGEAEGAMEHRLTPVVWETAHLKWIEEAASRLGIDDFAVHLEIDSGMSRQGVRPEAMTGFLHALERSPRVRVEGLMTHFHSPEMFESTATAAQMEKFGHAFERLAASGASPASGLTPAIASAGNSATALTPAVAQQIKALGRRFGAMPMIRPGLALYGYAPRFSGPGAKSRVAPAKDALAPVLSWKTRVISLRSIAAGKSAGYNATFRAARRTRLALLPVGYADGLNRLLSGDGAKDGRGGHVLVRGQRAPIAGRISMDLTTVDVTDIEGVALGDEVVLIGEQGGEQGPGDSRERITAYELADAAQTIPYEVLCAIGARVPRRLAEDGKSDA